MYFESPPHQYWCFEQGWCVRRWGLMSMWLSTLSGRQQCLDTHSSGFTHSVLLLSNIPPHTHTLLRIATNFQFLKSFNERQNKCFSYGGTCLVPLSHSPHAEELTMILTLTSLTSDKYIVCCFRIYRYTYQAYCLQIFYFLGNCCKMCKLMMTGFQITISVVTQTIVWCPNICPIFRFSKSTVNRGG